MVIVVYTFAINNHNNAFALDNIQDGDDVGDNIATTHDPTNTV